LKKINIAIDGFSSCGKSTLAKALAKHFNYIFVDTGAMYRAVSLFALRNNLFKNDQLNSLELVRKLPEITVSFTYNNATKKSETLLNGENVEKEIRNIEVSNLVSKVSEIKEVRQKLVALQQQLGLKKGVVMDGRDIGTVVFPTAELKIFMTADSEIRVLRRYNELLEKGENPNIEAVRKNIEVRDFIDTTRKEDPLKQAPDAIVLNNSNLSMDEQLDLVIAWVNERLV